MHSPIAITECACHVCEGHSALRPNPLILNSGRHEFVQLSRAKDPDAFKVKEVYGDYWNEEVSSASKSDLQMLRCQTSERGNAFYAGHIALHV
jgi:hypothetical protein